jgi:hypothetical protein
MPVLLLFFCLRRSQKSPPKAIFSRQIAGTNRHAAAEMQGTMRVQSRPRKIDFIFFNGLREFPGF